jgi:hypothetical protein
VDPGDPGLNGNIAPDTRLSGALTNLSGPSDVIVNAAGQLLVSNFTGQRITTYDNAASVTLNVAPVGNVQGVATGLTGPRSLAIDEVADLLLVVNQTNNTITTYSNTTDPNAFNGNLPFVRRIENAAINVPTGANFDDQGNLYVANNAGNNILVFDNAANITGNQNPSRTITSPAAFVDVRDAYVDSALDRLVVVDATGHIFTFFQASQLDGPEVPTFDVTVQGALEITAIAISIDGTGYIVDRTANAVWIYNNVATRNLTLAPDREIQGNQTRLEGPFGVFLLE